MGISSVSLRLSLLDAIACPLDGWPRAANGEEWDGTGLLALVKAGNSPFGDDWDVNALIHEVEESLQASVVDIPIASYGANHFGIRLQLIGRPDVVARLSRGDLNKPGFHPRAMEKQIMHDHFERATYDVLQTLGGSFDCQPLYHRDPVKSMDNTLTTCQDVSGRRLFLFQKAEGEHYHYGRWRDLSDRQKTCLLLRAAQLSAKLFRCQIPPEYASTWLWERIFNRSADLCPIPVAQTKEFCIALLTAKIEATLGCRNDFIDSEKGFHLINPSYALCRESLLRLVPRILPKPRRERDEAALYRFVLDHGDFGMHNMTVAMDNEDQPIITSVFDWEGGSIVPAILSEPKMVVTVDLVLDAQGKPSISRWGDGDSPAKMVEYRQWTQEYYKTLFGAAPEYKRVIKTGLDARHIWFSLQDLKNKDLDAHFGGLCLWAQRKEAELDAEDARRRGSLTSQFFCGLYT